METGLEVNAHEARTRPYQTRQKAGAAAPPAGSNMPVRGGGQAHRAMSAAIEC